MYGIKYQELIDLLIYIAGNEYIVYRITRNFRWVLNFVIFGVPYPSIVTCIADAKQLVATGVDTDT